jgi:hypothetical protein
VSSRQNSVCGTVLSAADEQLDTKVDYTSYRTCYVAVPLYICGFVLLGAAFQKHLSVGALVMGWGIAELAIMINTVAVCKLLFSSLHSPAASAFILRYGSPLYNVDCSIADAYCNNSFPRHQGEISALVNLARVLGGKHSPPSYL